MYEVSPKKHSHGIGDEIADVKSAEHRFVVVMVWGNTGVATSVGRRRERTKGEGLGDGRK